MICVLIINGCGDDAIFTMFEKSNLKIIIKGTYASNSPQAWINNGISADDSMGNADTSGEPTLFMLDIAEIKINNDSFANYRKVYSETLNEESSFFNGTGVSFPCDNVFPDKNYSIFKVYLRKMIFNNAYLYNIENSVWTEAEAAEVIFNEKNTLGYDFNQRQIYTYYDYISEGTSNKIFPISIPIIENFNFDRENNYIIEIRLVIKNYIKKYQYTYTDGENGVAFFALADFLRDMQAGDAYQGGNLIGVARVYNPEETVTVSGNAGAANCYVVAIPENEDIADYTITLPVRPAGTYLDEVAAWDNYDDAFSDIKIPPLAAWSSDGTYRLDNVPIGRNYKLYRSIDGHGAAAIPANFSNQTVTVTVDGTESNIIANLGAN